VENDFAGAVLDSASLARSIASVAIFSEESVLRAVPQYSVSTPTLRPPPHRRFQFVSPRFPEIVNFARRNASSPFSLGECLDASAEATQVQNREHFDNVSINCDG